MSSTPIESDSPAHNRAAALVPEIKKAAAALIQAEIEGFVIGLHLLGGFSWPATSAQAIIFQRSVK